MFGLMWILLASALLWVLASVVTSLVVGRVVSVADDHERTENLAHLDDAGHVDAAGHLSRFSRRG